MGVDAVDRGGINVKLIAIAIGMNSKWELVKSAVLSMGASYSLLFY